MPSLTSALSSSSPGMDSTAFNTPTSGSAPSSPHNIHHASPPPSSSTSTVVASSDGHVLDAALGAVDLAKAPIAIGQDPCRVQSDMPLSLSATSEINLNDHLASFQFAVGGAADSGIVAGSATDATSGLDFFFGSASNDHDSASTISGGTGATPTSAFDVTNMLFGSDSVDFGTAATWSPSQVPPATPATAVGDSASYFGQASSQRDTTSPPPVPAPAAVTSSSSSTTDEEAPKQVPPKRNGRKLPKPVTDLLKKWLLDHADHPYPNDQEKRMLCERTQLTPTQLGNWMINVSFCTHIHIPVHVFFIWETSGIANTFVRITGPAPNPGTRWQECSCVRGSHLDDAIQPCPPPGDEHQHNGK